MIKGSQDHERSQCVLLVFIIEKCYRKFKLGVGLQVFIGHFKVMTRDVKGQGH